MRPAGPSRLLVFVAVIVALVAAGIAIARPSVLFSRTDSPSARPAPAAEKGSGSTSAAGTRDGAGVTSGPERVCGQRILKGGPVQAPAGAVVVPAGDNSSLAAFDLRKDSTTFFFATGVHTLGLDQYGQITPGSGSSFIGAPGAVIDGQNRNLYAFTGEATRVTIEYLTVRNFGTGLSNNDQGVVNHDRGTGWVIRYNTFTANDGAAVMLGSKNDLSHNCLKDNGQYGFSAVPAQDASVVDGLVIDHNEVSGNNTDNWESRREGCGCTGGGKLWQVNNARITGNYLHDNRGTGLWADNDNRGVLIENNYIAGNDGHGVEYEVSYNFLIRHNTFIRNGLVEGAEFARKQDNFPIGAIYISESGGDSRAGSTYTASAITANLFQNNWDGVVLWENADRFCRPGEDFDTTNGCPFFDHAWGTRYKTQNIAISGNHFELNRAAIHCTELCGRQALISNYGSEPPNSPYLGTKIQDAITYRQNNVWSGNTYSGSWRFVGHDLDKDLTLEQWQAPPYRQDAGSTLS